MRAGLLRRQVTFQERVRSQNSTGEVEWLWKDFRTVRADVIPQTGMKFFVAYQLQAKVSTVIRIRYQAGFRTDMRIKYEKEPGKFQYFEVVSLQEVRERRHWIDCMCNQREADGWQVEKGAELSDVLSPAPEGEAGGG